MVGTLSRLPLAGGVPALTAAGGFVVIAVFQIALAPGAPLGRASWGGAHAGQLPAGLRVASAVAVGIWALAALIVLGRAGFAVSPLPASLTTWGTWILVCVLTVGALMNFASPSAWERFLWGPFTLILAALCLLVARSGPAISG